MHFPIKKIKQVLLFFRNLYIFETKILKMLEFKF